MAKVGDRPTLSLLLRLRCLVKHMLLVSTCLGSYSVTAICSFEKSTQFNVQKGEVALAIVAQVESPTKSDKHRADLYIEALQRIPVEEQQATKAMMLQLQRVTDPITFAGNSEPLTAEQADGIVRKCRKLGKYPTCPAEILDDAMAQAGA